MAFGETLSTKFISGSSNYVNFGNKLGFERNEIRSFSFWIKTTSVNKGIFIKRTGWPYTGMMAFINGRGCVYFILEHDEGASDYINASMAIDNGIADNRWHHVVITYDGSSTAAGFTMYKDSVLMPLVTSGVLTDTIVCANDFNLGRDDGGAYLDGSIDEFAIYDKVLSLAEVQWIYNSGTPNDLADGGAPSNLIHWLRMGDGDTYPTIVDTGGDHGTMTNMSYTNFTGDIPPNPLRIPWARWSINFDANEFASFGDVLDIERTDAASFSIWFKTVVAGGTTCPFMTKWGAAIPNGYAFEMTTTDAIFTMANSWAGANRLQVTSAFPASINDGKWHHIACTYDGSSAAGGVLHYLDGAVLVPTTVYDTLASTTVNAAEFKIAQWSDGGSTYNFLGKLDEAALYKKELSAAEITWIYNTGEPRDLAGPGAPSDLRGWWRCGDGADAGTGPGKIYDSSGNVYTGNLNNIDNDDYHYDAPGRHVSYPVPDFGDVLIGGSAIPTYIMMARDSGTAPPVYTSWVTTDPTSSPVTPPVGAWVDKTILHKY